MKCLSIWFISSYGFSIILVDYLNVIKIIQPDGFIIENVESILHPKNIIVVKEIEEFIYKNNFNLIRYTANAIKFGVPQKRKRVFFIATKKRIKFEPVQTHGENLKPYERVIDWIYQYENMKFFEKEESVKNKTYENELKQILSAQDEPAIILHADKTVDIEHVVKVMDIAYRNKYKIVLATKPN